MTKKAQVWSVDFLAGFILFMVVLLLSIAMIFNAISSTRYQELYSDGVHITSSLMSAGGPSDWNQTSVIIPGISNNNRLNFTKLEMYENLTYHNTKSLLHTPNDFLFFFKNKTGIINTTSCIYGYEDVFVDTDCEPIIGTLDYSNLVKFERILIINSSLSTMVLYVWN